MIEKHYAAYVMDDVTDIVRRAVEPITSGRTSRIGGDHLATAEVVTVSS